MTPRSFITRRAALLLEVVVAITIMIATLGILGSQLNAGLTMTARADEQSRATQLGDRILALLELDQQLMQQVFVDQKNDGDFGDQFPGWHWRVLVTPVEDIPGLGQVMIEILKQEDAKNIDSIEGAKVVRRFHLLKADPGRIDLAEDFGFSQDQVDALAASIPIPGFDPSALDPQALVAMDPAMLMEMLPQLMQLFQQLAASGGLPGGGLPGGLGDLQGLLGGLAGGGPPGGGGNDDQMAMLRQFILAQAGGRISEEEVDQALANLGRGGAGGGGPAGGGGGGRGPGGNGGGGRGPGGNSDGNQGGDGGDDAPPPPGGFSRDGLRDMLRGALGDRISDAELEQALDAYEQGQGNRAGGGG